MEVLKVVLFFVVLAGAIALWIYVSNPKVRPLTAQQKEQIYRRRVEAEVIKRLDAERFEADVQRRLEAARSSDPAREEV